MSIDPWADSYVSLCTLGALAPVRKLCGRFDAAEIWLRLSSVSISDAAGVKLGRIGCVKPIRFSICRCSAARLRKSSRHCCGGCIVVDAVRCSPTKCNDSKCKCYVRRRERCRSQHSYHNHSQTDRAATQFSVLSQAYDVLSNLAEACPVHSIPVLIEKKIAALSAIDLYTLLVCSRD